MTTTAAAARGGSASVHVTVRLQRHTNDAGTTAATMQRGKAVTISYAAVEATNTNGSDDLQKYMMCSLLLQVGKILGVRPSHAPSPRVSSIFDKLLEKWCLRWKGAPIEKLCDVEAFNGDELVLCCGDYVEGAAASSSTVDLLELIPARSNVVTVTLAEEASGDGTSAVDGGDSDSVEDVTELNRSKRARASPEVIDLQDASSDDGSECCFWEYDEHGNMKRKVDHLPNSLAARTTGAANNGEGGRLEIESISSDSSDSSVEDVTELMKAKREEEMQQMKKEAEEIGDSDEDGEEGPGKAGKKRKRRTRQQSSDKRRKKKATESPIEVQIDDDDLPQQPGGKVVDDTENDEVDHAIKQRIVKLLNTGFHDESNEHEARNAMKLARRLMELI